MWCSPFSTRALTTTIMKRIKASRHDGVASNLGPAPITTAQHRLAAGWAGAATAD